MSEDEVKALEKETAEKLATAFQECVKEAEAEDEEASQATVQFLEKMLAEGSTVSGFHAECGREGGGCSVLHAVVVRP